MKKMVKVAVVVAVLATLTLGQSALMAAPIQGASRAMAHSSSMNIYRHFLSLLSAVWGGHAGVWTGGHGGSTQAGVWGGNGSSGH